MKTEMMLRLAWPPSRTPIFRSLAARGWDVGGGGVYGCFVGGFGVCVFGTQLVVVESLRLLDVFFLGGGTQAGLAQLS